MKQLFSIFIVLALICSPVLAANEPMQLKKDSEGNLALRETEQIRAESANQLQQMVQEREQQMVQEMSGKGSEEKKVLQNQNRVRLAVHSLLAMEDLVGGVGNQVSALAREFDNSIQKTIRAEENIRERSGLARMFVGGDHEAAEDLEEEVKSNKVRIEQLKQLKNQCDCGAEVKAMFQEQIANMEQEQTRLQDMSKEEKDSKGLFGWLWK